jgi:Flp pilus assembly protein TadD
MNEPPPTKVSKTYLRETLTRLRQNPEDLDALFTFGTWLAMTERYDEAVEVLHEITKRDPNYPGVWVLKSQVYKRMGKSRMAELCMERDLAIQNAST